VDGSSAHDRHDWLQTLQPLDRTRHRIFTEGDEIGQMARLERSEAIGFIG
jgi:hypothetical protein